MAKSRDKTKEGYWRRLVRERKHGGQSVAEFCHQRGIPVHQFYWWQRQLRLRDRSKQLTRSTDSQDFIPVRVPVHLPPIELLHPGGCVLRISAGVDPQSLRCVLDALSPRER